MTRGRWTVAALMFVAASLATRDARAQASSRGLERLAPATRATVDRLADSLTASGLSAEPIYAKAAEGVLKGADDARILAAVRTLARELGEARLALGASATPAEVFAGATVLHMGVSSSAIQRLREARDRGVIRVRGDAAMATPLVVLGDLVTRGVPPGVAISSIDAMIAHGAPDADFATLRAAVARDIDAGHAPDAAAATRTRAVLQAIDARRPAPRPRD